ncbi:hypothetical protein [Cohnella faecalis]|uniref:hypothetical protein n=1 Tax=Cohnella faecalis TaxID=2315694 RepID=UPI001F48D5BA|nr:hypothetical protein [Cohnella faecalis]
MLGMMTVRGRIRPGNRRASSRFAKQDSIPIETATTPSMLSLPPDPNVDVSIASSASLS